MDKIPVTFQAEITQHSPIENNSGFTLCRARVFYTGLNRNGSYISPDFAKEFINTASGCPIVGLWDREKNDFTDHQSSDRKRAYGFIPEDPHFAWEEVSDYDGKLRQYATFDVVLWTKAFSEANEIISHPLSMELDPESISGTFMIIEGEYCFYFQAAQMLGVCVLGYDVEPCFEGARFIGIEQAKEFKRLFQIDKEQALLTYNNKGDTLMEEEKEKVPAEEYSMVRDDDIEEPISEQEPELEPDSTVETSSEFMVATEETAPEEDTIPEEVQENNDFSAEKEKFINTVAELERQNENFKNRIQELEDKVTKLEKENFSLKEFRQNKEKEEKLDVLKSYSNVLTKEETDELNLNEFSKDELNDKLAAMAYRKISNHNSADFQLINTNLSYEENDVDSIIRKYKEN